MAQLIFFGNKTTTYNMPFNKKKKTYNMPIRMYVYNTSTND